MLSSNVRVNTETSTTPLAVVCIQHSATHLQCKHYHKQKTNLALNSQNDAHTQGQVIRKGIIFWFPPYLKLILVFNQSNLSTSEFSFQFSFPPITVMIWMTIIIKGPGRKPENKIHSVNCALFHTSTPGNVSFSSLFFLQVVTNKISTIY